MVFIVENPVKNATNMDILGNPHVGCSEADMLKGMFNSSGFYAGPSEQVSTNHDTY